MLELLRPTGCLLTLLLVQETSTTRCDMAKWRWNSANGSAMSDALPGPILCWPNVTHGQLDHAIPWRQRNITVKPNVSSQELGIIEDSPGYLGSKPRLHSSITILISQSPPSGSITRAPHRRAVFNMKCQLGWELLPFA